MLSSFLLSLLSAGALTLALPYSSTEPTTTTTLDAFTNYPVPAAPTDGLNLPKSNLTSAANTTSSTTSSKLGSHWGWIGSFDKGDCTGKPHNNRPEVNGDCQKFTPETDFVGVSWGSWPWSFDSFDVFTDENCKNFASKTIKKPDYDNKVGPGSCYSVSKLGGHWGSFRKHYDSPE